MQEEELATCRQSSQSCRGTTIHKLKPQATCYWVESQQRFSHLQTRKYTPVHSSPRTQPLTKTSFSAFTLKIARNLHQHRGRSLKESTFYWETQMGGCFKTKQTGLLLTQHLLSDQNCIALQLRNNVWDSSSPGLWEKSFHAVCPLWKAMLAGVSASGWKMCCQRSNNSHKEKNYSTPLIQRKRRW